MSLLFFSPLLCLLYLFIFQPLRDKHAVSADYNSDMEHRETEVKIKEMELNQHLEIELKARKEAEKRKKLRKEQMVMILTLTHTHIHVHINGRPFCWYTIHVHVCMCVSVARATNMAQFQVLCSSALLSIVIGMQTGCSLLLRWCLWHCIMSLIILFAYNVMFIKSHVIIIIIYIF